MLLLDYLKLLKLRTYKLALIKSYKHIKLRFKYNGEEYRLKYILKSGIDRGDCLFIAGDIADFRKQSQLKLSQASDVNSRDAVKLIFEYEKL